MSLALIAYSLSKFIFSELLNDQVMGRGEILFARWKTEATKEQERRALQTFPYRQLSLGQVTCQLIA